MCVHNNYDSKPHIFHIEVVNIWLNSQVYSPSMTFWKPLGYTYWLILDVKIMYPLTLLKYSKKITEKIVKTWKFDSMCHPYQIGP